MQEIVQLLHTHTHPCIGPLTTEPPLGPCHFYTSWKLPNELPSWGADNRAGPPTALGHRRAKQAHHVHLQPEPTPITCAVKQQEPGGGCEPKHPSFFKKEAGHCQSCLDRLSNRTATPPPGKHQLLGPTFSKAGKLDPNPRRVGVLSASSSSSSKTLSR